MRRGFTVHRSDPNQAEIVDALRAVGCRVHHLKSTIDLLVGVPAGGLRPRRIILLEVKTDAKAKLKPSQELFFEVWQGYEVYRVNSIADALEVSVGLP